MISDEAKARIDAADIIISKGMGNYETMIGTGYNIYFLLLCKCDRFMRLFDQPYLSSVFCDGKKPIVCRQQIFLFKHVVL